jgi:hypothetical protein
MLTVLVIWMYVIATTYLIGYGFLMSLVNMPGMLPGKKSKKHAPQLSQLTYNLPGNACIQVNYKNRSLTERTVPVAQLGADVPLSKDLFSGNDLPVIVFSEKTGNIVSISK